MMTTIDPHALRLAVSAQLQQLNRSFIRREVPPGFDDLAQLHQDLDGICNRHHRNGCPFSAPRKLVYGPTIRYRVLGITSGAGRSYTLS